MFAVIKTGGKQYLVREGEQLNVEKLEKDAGAKLEFEALLVADEDDKEVKVGKPNVGQVQATVVEQGRAKKVAVIKYKPKVRYRRNVGHRQPFTKIKIEKIVA
ncbi:MAG: 50S ribosomal protein L21 [Patescibacteria group bacterium]|jgi:large subunit ribosomal protein L21